MLLSNFCLAVLAALGLDALSSAESLSKRRTRVFLGVVALAAVATAAMLHLRRTNLMLIEPDRADQMLRAIFVYIAFATAGWLWLAAANPRVTAVFLSSLASFPPLRPFLAGGLRAAHTTGREDGPGKACGTQRCAAPEAGRPPGGGGGPPNERPAAALGGLLGQGGWAPHPGPS